MKCIATTGSSSNGKLSAKSIYGVIPSMAKTATIPVVEVASTSACNIRHKTGGARYKKSSLRSQQSHSCNNATAVLHSNSSTTLCIPPCTFASSSGVSPKPA